ncbi:SRPBCC domain-containing protein [Arthrobacter sp. KBS0702]|nr:SRPBCC domain-containing protein [Arthrobacter sp. KBS0702]
MEITMNENTLRFTRTFEAPRQLVFDCMIDPEHLTHFWGPIGVTTPLKTITVDARVGGAFTTVMVNDGDGSTYPTSARYLEVNPPDRLSWIEDHSGMTVTITFTELGTRRTQVDIVQTHVPAPMMDPAAQAGFLTSLDRFDTYLTERTGANR